MSNSVHVGQSKFQNFTMCAQHSQELSLRHGEFHQRRIDAAHRRYLAAMKSLALVRRLQIPPMQANFAEKQVNVLQGGTQGSTHAGLPTPKASSAVLSLPAEANRLILWLTPRAGASGPPALQRAGLGSHASSLAYSLE